MKKLAPAAVIGGLVVPGPAGPANAQTSPNDGDARQGPERARPCDVHDQTGAGTIGGGKGTANLTPSPGRDPDGNRLGQESPSVFLISVIRLTATVNVG